MLFLTIENNYDKRRYICYMTKYYILKNNTYIAYSRVSRRLFIIIMINPVFNGVYAIQITAIVVDGIKIKIYTKTSYNFGLPT